MNDTKQKLLIEYLISSPDTFAICQRILNPTFFDPEFRNSVTFINDYYEKYHTTPSIEQIKAEHGLEFTLYEINQDQITYCTDEVEQFCKRRAMEEAIISSAPLVGTNDYGKIEAKIRDAVLLSLNRDLGLRYFETPEVRLNKMLEADPVESTGWKEVDQLLYGGVGRKEMILFSASSGVGKSITLSNLGYNFLLRKRNVVYITLELSEEIVAQRFDTMITGISRKEWKGHVNEIATNVSSFGATTGKLDIKYMPTGTKAMAIRGFLKEYYLQNKHMPDLLIVDYLDKMSPNEFVSADNAFQKDKLCSEQLRQLAVDFNMVVATASQMNREAVKAKEHDHSHIAGGISKINETDVYISIKASDAMKAQGEILFQFQKTRNSDGVGKTVLLNWNAKTLRITDSTKSQPTMLVRKESKTFSTDKPAIKGTVNEQHAAFENLFDVDD